MNTLKHSFFSLLRFVGMRDRLRCPRCKAVGTWKPHGWVDPTDTRKVRRWMCKWCGLYHGPESETEVVPSPSRGCWVLRSEEPTSLSPKEALEANPVTAKCWPWRG